MVQFRWSQCGKLQELNNIFVVIYFYLYDYPLQYSDQWVLHPCPLDW